MPVSPLKTAQPVLNIPAFSASPGRSKQWLPIVNDKVAVQVSAEQTRHDYPVIQIVSVPSGGGSYPLLAHKKDVTFLNVYL